MPEDSVPAVESGTAQVSHLSPSADGALLNRDSARDGVNSSRFVLPIVLLTNANRLYNKIDELFCLVNREHLDLISITETWLTTDVPDSVYHLPNFVIFRKDRPDRLGGGVLCFARFSLQPYAIDRLLDRSQDFELLWIAMRPPRLPIGLLALS